jgi:hypothetical protein
VHWHYWYSVARMFVKEVFGHTEPRFESFSVIARTAPESSENLFDPRAVKVGDVVAGLTVADLPDLREYGWVERDDMAIAKFKGEVTLTGRYICTPEEELLESRTPDLPRAVFLVGEESATRLPQIIGDNRGPWFMITNVLDAGEHLGPPGSEARATIVSDDYVIRLHPSSEGINLTRLARVIEKEVLKDPAQSDGNTGLTRSDRFSASTANIHDYMPRLLAGEEVSAYELLPCLENFTRQTWREFDEFYRSEDPDNPGATGEHWFNALFTALANAAIAQNPYDREDQSWRNYYIDKASLTSDGASSQSLADIMMNQWTADPVVYSSTLNRLFPSEEADSLRKYIAYHIRYFYDIWHADDSLFGIVKPIVENRAYPGGIYLAAYPVDFPFCFDLAEKTRKSYQAESFGEVTVVDCGDFQVTYLNPHDGVYTIITLRAKESPYQAVGVKIGDTEQSLMARLSPDNLKKVESISYDDEAWFGSSHDYAYAYTPKDSTKSLLHY